MLLALWAGHNAWRYDDFTVARGTNIAVPFFRTFMEERIVAPENGPSSREFAAAVEEHLLPEEPYRSYGIDVDTFFSSGSGRMIEDAASLTDRVFGWDSDYAILRKVGTEAVREHPGAYARGVTETMWSLLRGPAYVTPPSSGGGGASAAGEPETVVIDGQVLPKPSEGQPIPGSRQGLWTSTPDNRIEEVWTSPTDHHLIFRYPEDEARVEHVDSEVARLIGRLPDRAGNAELAHRLNQAAYRFPPPGLWLVVGLVAVVWRRPRGVRVALALAGASLLLLARYGARAARGTGVLDARDPCRSRCWPASDFSGLDTRPSRISNGGRAASRIDDCGRRARRPRGSNRSGGRILDRCYEAEPAFMKMLDASMRTGAPS